MLFFPVYTDTNPHPFRSISVAHRPAPTPPSRHPKPFIINTYISISKQAALTTCRMNTYEKQGEGVLRLTEYPVAMHSMDLEREAHTYLGGEGNADRCAWSKEIAERP